MQQADTYPPLGPEYDDDPAFMPSRRAVLGIICILLAFACVFGAAMYYGLIKPLISYYL